MSILDLIFPTQFKCVTCGTETNKVGICENCLKFLTLIPEPTCCICGGENFGNGQVCFECKGRHFAFTRNYSIFVYADDVRKKIVDFKQNGHKAIGEMLSYFIADMYDKISSKHNIDLIIPVPISSDRLKTRKFNQSEVLCKELLSTNKVRTDVFARIKSTPHQAGLSRHNREENLRDAFVVIDKVAIKGKTILIVDDIYTTGSTLNACAKILKTFGAKEVIALTLSRAPIKKDKIVEKSIDEQHI